MPAQEETKTPIAVPEEHAEEAASRSALQPDVQDDDIKVVHSIRHHTPDHLCPVCGEKLINEKCKIVCRSETCIYRLVFNCSEY